VDRVLYLRSFFYQEIDVNTGCGLFCFYFYPLDFVSLQHLIFMDNKIAYIWFIQSILITTSLSVGINQPLIFFFH